MASFLCFLLSVAKNWRALNFLKPSNLEYTMLLAQGKILQIYGFICIWQVTAAIFFPTDIFATSTNIASKLFADSLKV